VLRQITKAASDELNIGDPCRAVENVSTRGHRTHTYEEPNALKPEDVARFLGEMRARAPQHYAMVFLGFTTGLRPSSLRPLRRRGKHADVKWNDGKLLVRRSHTHRGEVMEATKTDTDQVIALDPEQVSVLRWHCERLDASVAQYEKDGETETAAALRASDLLFPAPPTRWSRGGGFRSRSSLRDAFAEVGTALKLGYDVSPKAMRRTFQDLARAAAVADVVTRAISGHATESMQRHYSTVSDGEVRAGLAKVIELATGRERKEPTATSKPAKRRARKR
jgi:integrase